VDRSRGPGRVRLGLLAPHKFGTFGLLHRRQVLHPGQQLPACPCLSQGLGKLTGRHSRLCTVPQGRRSGTD
jgi:hypothetical protein